MERKKKTKKQTNKNYINSSWSIYLAKRNWDKNPIWFQNPMSVFKHCHDFIYCFGPRIPWVSTVHEQYILQNQKL